MISKIGTSCTVLLNYSRTPAKPTKSTCLNELSRKLRRISIKNSNKWQCLDKTKWIRSVNAIREFRKFLVICKNLPIYLSPREITWRMLRISLLWIALKFPLKNTFPKMRGPSQNSKNLKRSKDKENLLLMIQDLELLKT